MTYDAQLHDLWEEAVLGTDLTGEFSVDFYEDEYNRVVAAQEAFTLEK